MRVLLTNLVLALGLSAVSLPTLARAQDSAQDRISTAAGNLESVQAMRFAGQANVSPAGGGDSVRIFQGTGEFQGPDRGRMTVEEPQLLQVTDTITVGTRSWLKTVDGSAWVPLNAAVAGPAPRSIAEQLRQVARYFVAPSVTEGDSQTQIYSDVDLARAITEESSVGGVMGVQYCGESDQGTQVNGSNVTISIDKSTNLPVSLTTSLSVVCPATPEGVPAGAVIITTNLTLSDFNSTEIAVQIPGE